MQRCAHLTPCADDRQRNKEQSDGQYAVDDHERRRMVMLRYVVGVMSDEQ